MYELYCKVGQPTFNRIMQEYYNRYALSNATITGWLQTIGDIAGENTQEHMRKALYEPNFDLADEYKLTPEEEQRLMGLMLKKIYDRVFSDGSNIPQEVFARMYHRAYNGEPVTIVLSDGVTKKAMEQQKQLAEQIQMMMQLGGIETKIITERLVVKKQKDASGAYMVKHPYHDDRLLMHIYWTAEQVNAKALPAMMQMMTQTTNFSSDFYQWFQMNGQGKITSEKFVVNPISKLFE